MAEERIGSLLTPEDNILDTGNISRNSARSSDSLSNRKSTLARPRRASVGSYPAADRSSRNPAGKSNSAESSQNVVPHYLRASTGSCHDSCKFGKAHSFEKKARKPLQKKIAKPLPKEAYSVQILVSDGPKKEKVVNTGPSTGTKERSPYQKPSSDAKSYSLKPKSSLGKDKAMKLQPSKDTKHCSPGVPSLPTNSYSRIPKVPSDAKTFTAKENGSSGNKTLLSKSKPSYTKKFPPADSPEIVKSVIFPSTVVKDSVKQGSSTDNKTPRAEKKAIHVSQKHSSPVKSKTLKVKPLSSENSDFMRGKGRRISNAKTEKIATATKAPVKNALVAPTANVSHKLSMNKTARLTPGKAGNLKMESPLEDQYPSPLDDQNSTRTVKAEGSIDEKVSEKTLHVVETDTDNNVFEFVPVDHAPPSLPSPFSMESLSSANSSTSSFTEEDNAETDQSDGESDEYISDDDGTEEIVDVQPVKENQNNTLSKSRVAVAEEECHSPVKLKFRRGKVVDLQSDNNTPRRLRFRKARSLGAEDGKRNSRRALKKADVIEPTTGAEVSSEQVILKHQDVQEKDAQGLLNNVIEETASKLVESRKSKVKALVGAFETVISLHDGKPAT